MGALSIAFDTIIVGALALSWVALVVHLFLSREEKGLQALLDWVKHLNQPAAASVVLFAGAYFLGSVVSRIAQDFFNDDDLYIRAGRLYEVITEDSIRTSVYCSADMDKEWIAAPGHFKPDCSIHQRVPLWFLPVQRNDDFKAKTAAEDPADTLDDRVQDLFHYQESTLLLKGQDATERLRQLKDQISVLRGVAFNGFLAFSFCLFGWCAMHPPNPRWMRARDQVISPWLVVPLFYLAAGAVTFAHHLDNRSLAEPPFMEFTLLVLGLAGAGVLWKAMPKALPGHGAHAVHAKPVPTKPRSVRGSLVLISLLCTATAFLGWWMTEVMYDQQVIYSYYAQSPQSSK